MDSLLVNYASSDDDADAEVSRPVFPPKISSDSVAPKASSSLLPSLPPPRSSTSSYPSPSSSLFSTLPPPKPQLGNQSINHNNGEDFEGKPLGRPLSSSIFSFLPPPKTSLSSSFSSVPVPKPQSGNPTNKPSLDQNHKRIVHFSLPLNPSILKSQDSDSDDEEEERRRKARKDASSSSTLKALSSLLPAPKNSLGTAPSQSSSTYRRSSLQAVNSSKNSAEEEPVSINYKAGEGVAAGYYDTLSYNSEQEVVDNENYMNDLGNWSGNAVDHGAIASVDSTYISNPAITCWEQVNGDAMGYGSYVDHYSIVSGGEKRSYVPDIGRITGKRGRTDIPAEIVEVKQDELMKNRPREDQVKLTGIAFGPAYQPAPSAKGKPSKLHKRKHQIGSLYYDLKQKEMELAERRSRGLLTKSETQAKYGW